MSKRANRTVFDADEINSFRVGTSRARRVSGYHGSAGTVVALGAAINVLELTDTWARPARRTIQAFVEPSCS